MFINYLITTNPYSYPWVYILGCKNTNYIWITNALFKDFWIFFLKIILRDKSLFHYQAGLRLKWVFVEAALHTMPTNGTDKKGFTTPYTNRHHKSIHITQRNTIVYAAVCISQHRRLHCHTKLTAWANEIGFVSQRSRLHQSTS